MSPRLIVVWGMLLLLIGAIAAIELRDRAAAPSAGSGPVRDPRLLLPVSIEQVGAIEIAYGGAVHRFERDADGAWFYHGAHAPAQAGHAHQIDPAMASADRQAFAGFDRARMERDFPLQDGGKELGVATPKMVILAYRPNELQPLAQYAVGDIAPDKFSRYVLPVGKPQVVTIANYQIDNLTGLIEAVAGPGACCRPCADCAARGGGRCALVRPHAGDTRPPGCERGGEHEPPQSIATSRTPVMPRLLQFATAVAATLAASFVSAHTVDKGLATISLDGQSVNYHLMLAVSAVTPQGAASVDLGQPGATPDYSPLLKAVQEKIAISSNGKACTPATPALTPPAHEGALVILDVRFACTEAPANAGDPRRSVRRAGRAVPHHRECAMAGRQSAIRLHDAGP